MPVDSSLRDILIVDQPGSGAGELRRLLGDAGFTTYFAGSGEEAAALVPAHTYAAAIVASVLPDMSGGACIRELQRRDRDLPCLVVATAPTIESVIEVANLSIFGYAVRPVHPKEFLDLVARAVEHRRLEDELREERLRTAQLLGILQAIETIQDRINNPLQVILGYAELLNTSASDEDEETRQFSQRIMEAGGAIADVVAKLRHVRRPATRKWSFGETLDLDEAGPDTNDRRLHPRLISVMLARFRGRVGRRWHFVDDLSRGGLSVHVTDAEEVPEEVEVELADPESGETYQCRAERVWVDVPQRRAGLRFREVDPRLSEQLRPEPEEQA
jgi:CheY-like chemotaxis protein